MTKGVRNYYKFSTWVNKDELNKGDSYFLKDPSRVLNADLERGFDFAFWEWMTPRGGQPSAHEIITGIFHDAVYP